MNGAQKLKRFFVICLLCTAVLAFAWVMANRYGSEPSYYADSYSALKADLSHDCPGIRFPDLTRYSDGAGFRYKVIYDGGRLSMRNRRYQLTCGDGGDGMIAGASSLSGLSVEALDLRSASVDLQPGRDGTSHVSIAGVDAGTAYVEGAGAGGTPFDRHSLAFDLGDYRYRVTGTFRMPEGGDSADAREAALSEVMDIAESIIG